MSRRPVGAPIVEWTAQRRWLDTLAEAGRTTEELAAQFAPAIAREVARFAPDDHPLFLVSPSLGGLSALAAARLLRERGHRPRIATEAGVLTAERPSPVTVAAFKAALADWDEVRSFEDATSATLVVDALYPADGVYYQRPEPDWVGHWRRLLTRAGTTIAIDNVAFALPVGASMTVVDRHPIYTATIALGALRDQHVTWPVMDHAGHLLLAPADPPVASNWRVLGRPVIETPATDAHKYSRGMVVVVAGAMPGAARLAARAAAASGAGYVLLAGAAVGAGAGLDAIVHRTIETAAEFAELLNDARIGAVVIGPGLGTDEAAQGWLDAALASDRRLVLDADALTLIGTSGRLQGRQPETWITPHYGEWVKLTGDTIFEFGKFAQTAWWAEDGLGIIHKGADTVVATPEGASVLDRGPPSWLSTAGTGDVLAGVLGARLAVRGGEWRCGHEAAWLQARAAELAGPAFAGDRLVDLLPHAIAECR